MTDVKPIPEGFHTVTPSLIVSPARDAIEFYKKAFDAKEIYQFPSPDGKIMHAQLKLGDSLIMLADEFPLMGSSSPKTIGGTSVVMHLYVTDADKVYNQAIKAGAEVLMPLMDTFWGDRYGLINDPYGHAWAISTHKKDMLPEELRKAGEQFFANMGKK